MIDDCPPYTRNTAVFTCPDDYDRDEEGRSGSYRLASPYRGLPLSCGWKGPYNPAVIAQPAATRLTYEAEQDFSQSPIVATYRQSDGTQVLLFGDHARGMRRMQ